MSDLLHPVRLCDVSADARALLKQLSRGLLEAGLRPAAAVLGPEEFRPCYLGGASKTKYHALLKTDPELKALSFVLGQRRLWRRADLDRWVEGYMARQALQVKPPVVQVNPQTAK